METYLTVADVATALRVSRWTVGRLIDAEELTAIKGEGRNGAVRIALSSVNAYIQRHTVTAKETR